MLWWDPDTPCPCHPTSCQTSKSIRKKMRYDLPEASPCWLLEIIPSLSKGLINLSSDNSLYNFTRNGHQVCLFEASGTHGFALLLHCNSSKGAEIGFVITHLCSAHLAVKVLWTWRLHPCHRASPLLPSPQLLGMQLLFPPQASLERSILLTEKVGKTN